MFGTMVRQIRYGMALLKGGRLDPAGLRATVADLRATIEEFGEPGEEAGALLPGGVDPDLEIRRTMADRRLRKTVRQAAAHVPYYHSWFRENGVDPRDITLDTLDKLPPTSKAALRGAASSFVSDDAEPVLLAQTTGTTGPPTSVWFSRYELELAAALSAMSFIMVNGCRERHVVMSTISSRATLAKLTVQQALAMVGAGFVPLGTVDPRIALDRLTERRALPGKEPQVTHLITNASYLGSLVQLVERGPLTPSDFGSLQVLVGGEVLSDPLRRRAEEALGARIIETYAMTETMPTAGIVCEAGHLHLAPEQAHIEVLDPLSHLPAAPGEVGMLVVTPYTQYRDTTLLLRYATGDLVRVLPAGEPVACSMAGMPATSRLLGRTYGALTTRAILDLLQAVPDVPLPSRYALDGNVLHVVAGESCRSQLEERVGALPLTGLVLVEDAADLPEPCRVRADLTEHSFELHPET